MSGSLGKWLAAAVVVLAGWSACTAGELPMCESDGDCGDGAVCRQAFCVREVPPDLVVTADDDEELVLRRHPDRVYRLAEVRDRSGNTTRVEWDGEEVSAVVDCVGRRCERRV